MSETFVLIAWLATSGYFGESMNSAATSLSVEFASAKACEFAGERLSEDGLRKREGDEVTRRWQFICVPKG